MTPLDLKVNFFKVNFLTVFLLAQIYGFSIFFAVLIVLKLTRQLTGLNICKQS